MDDKALQKQYMQYKVLQEQAEQLQKLLEHQNEQQMHLLSTISALDDMRKLKKGDPLLVPIANGIFINASLVNAKELTVNVGNNVLVSKSPEDTKKLLEQQQSSMSEIREQVESQLQNMAQQMHVLEESLTKAVQDV